MKGGLNPNFAATSKHNNVDGRETKKQKTTGTGSLFFFLVEGRKMDFSFSNFFRGSALMLACAM